MTQRPAGGYAAFFLVIAGCAAGGPASHARTECPEIATPGTRYPFMQYVTWVIDGRVVTVRQRQLVRGPHSVEVVDSVSPIHSVDPGTIEGIRVLTGDSALAYERCPGVKVLAITLERYPTER